MLTLNAPELPKFETESARETYFRQVLGSARRWAYIGLLEVYANQNSLEQQSRSTFDRNGIGFNSADAEICSSFADQLNRKIKSYGNDVYLSSRQDAVLFRIMPKYRVQVIAALEAKGLPGIAVAASGTVISAPANTDNIPALEMFMSGEIVAKQTGDYHCGLPVGDGKASFRYEVLCVARLDRFGFVVDNQEIKRWFDSITEVSASCEMLCAHACDQVWAMMEKPVGVSVKIWGLPDVAYAKAKRGEMDGGE
jgi:hypothetical protein